MHQFSYIVRAIYYTESSHRLFNDGEEFSGFEHFVNLAINLNRLSFESVEEHAISKLDFHRWRAVPSGANGDGDSLGWIVF